MSKGLTVRVLQANNLVDYVIGNSGNSVCLEPCTATEANAENVEPVSHTGLSGLICFLR